MLDPFILRAILGVLFASLSMPVLVMMLLRGSLYITPEISHAALGGAALGVLIQMYLPILLDPFPIVIIFCVATAAFISYAGKGQHALGTTLSVALAISVTLYAVIRSCYLPADKRVLVDGYLISDLLLLSDVDILGLAAASTIAVTVTLMFCREFIYICFDMDTAETLGLRVRLYDLLLFSTSAAAIAVITKAVGVLLSVTLLILPVASSGILTKNIGNMIIISFIMSILSGITGIALSLQFNMPTGGTISAVSTILFLMVYLARLKK